MAFAAVDQPHSNTRFTSFLQGWGHTSWGQAEEETKERVAATLNEPLQLSEYPTIPLEQYVLDPNFWYINKAFPGLQAVHRDPWIFICPELLSAEQCASLIEKASPHMTKSMMEEGDGTYHESTERTSSDVLIPYDEVPGIQKCLSELLNMPTSHFEPLKVTRYRTGEYFLGHNDAFCGMPSPTGYVDAPTPFANRVVATFVYLTDCLEGGETYFELLDVTIRPCRGLGVIFFPAHMNNTADPALRGYYDERVYHEGLPPTIGEKFVCVQWGWTGPLIRDKLAKEYRAKGRCSDMIL